METKTLAFVFNLEVMPIFHWELILKKMGLKILNVQNFLGPFSQSARTAVKLDVHTYHIAK